MQLSGLEPVRSHHKYLIESIEKIQKKFIMAIPRVGHLGYQDSLKALKLKSLIHRLPTADLCLLCKIILIILINNLISIDLINHNHFANYTSTRGHQFKLRPNFFSTDSTKFFFINCIIIIWNSLPKNIVSSTNLQSIHLPHQRPRTYSLLLYK